MEKNSLAGRRRRVKEANLEVQEAEAQLRLKQLQLAGYRPDARVSDRMEGFPGGSYDSPANIYNPLLYWGGEPGYLPNVGGTIPDTRSDKDEGRNFPFFVEEQQLALLRGVSRNLFACNPNAKGAKAALINYVMGKGFKYAAAPKRPEAKELAFQVHRQIEKFLDVNDWCCNMDRELYDRAIIDGENFPTLTHVGNGQVQARIVDPIQVTEPANKRDIEVWAGHDLPSSWTFGIHTPLDDIEQPHGIYVQFSDRDFNDWEYYPSGPVPLYPANDPQAHAKYAAHYKRNTPRNVKRGMPDAFSIAPRMNLSDRLQTNMGEGGAIQAAIAYIRHVVPGTTQAVNMTSRLSNPDASYQAPTQNGNKTVPVQRFGPGTIIDAPSGQEYAPSPLGEGHADTFIAISDALLRSCATIWNMPENLITGSSQNNNYASSLVAEAPFTKYAETEQEAQVHFHRKLLWHVVKFGWRAGLFGDISWPELQDNVAIQIEPPTVRCRDSEKETRTNQILFQEGILSPQTWAAKESLDDKQEAENRKALGLPSIADIVKAQMSQGTGAPGEKPPGGTGKTPFGLGKSGDALNAAEDKADDAQSQETAVAGDQSSRDPAGQTGVPVSESAADVTEAFDSSKHPRGQPNNKGEFGPGGTGPEEKPQPRPGAQRQTEQRPKATEQPEKTEPAEQVSATAATEDHLGAKTPVKPQPEENKPAEKPSGDQPAATTDSQKAAIAKWGHENGIGDKATPEWFASFKAVSDRAASTIREAVSAGKITPEQGTAYHNSFRTALKGMNQGSLDRLASNVQAVHFFGDIDDIGKAGESLTKTPMQKGQRMAAFWSFKPTDGGKGELFLDGGSDTPQKKPNPHDQTTTDIYAHELSHAIDGHSEFSASDEWKKAWESEVAPKDNPISNYASTNTAEGFAEFGRLVVAEPKVAELLCPQCWGYWKSKGLVD